MYSDLVLKPTLNYVKAELIVNCFVVLFTLAVVTLRVFGRCTGPGLWWDDYLVLLAMVGFGKNATPRIYLADKI